MFKIIAFCIIRLFVQLYVGVVILIVCRKHLHGRIISLRGEFWAHRTSLTPPFFYWSSYAKPGKWEVMYLCVRGIDLHLSKSLTFDFGIVPTMWYLFLFYPFIFTRLNIQCVGKPHLTIHLLFYFWFLVIIFFSNLGRKMIVHS